MSAAPTNEPVDDPWQVPTPQVPAAKKATATKKTVPAKKTATAKKAAQRPLTREERKQVQLRKLAQNQRRLAARSTWTVTYRWTLAGAVARLVTAAVLVVLGFTYAHLHGLAVTHRLDASSAPGAKGSLFPVLLIVALVTPSQAWQRSRGYVSKLPGVAPHPLQESKELYRNQSIPAFWPPVPEGAASWTRRLSWRVPPGLGAAFALLMLGGSGYIRLGFAGSEHYGPWAVISFAAAPVALVLGLLDLVRLRAYSRWPGRP